MTDDLPLALRRPRRTSTAPHDVPTSTQRSTSCVSAVTTPSRGKKKRVRFSDPGQSTGSDVDADADDVSSLTTGLTPLIRRTRLTPSSGGTKRRRHSGSDALDSTAIPYSGEVTFLPLRQVLDGRVKRRIRRNGLSEEMNLISAEKRRKAQQTKAEMDALRAEVAAKDAQIRRLSGVTAVADEDDESIDDLKKQAEQLRQSLRSPAPSHTTETSGTSESIRAQWTIPSPGPFTGNYSDMDIDFNSDDDDDVFGDSTIAELACSTPSRRRPNIRNSFPTPPSTGSPPPRILTPCERRIRTPTSNVAVQVHVPDSEKMELEEELVSLHLEIEKLTSTLETYEAMTTRVSAKLSSLVPESGGSAANAILATRSPAVRVEVQLNNLLKTFVDRSAALADLDSSLGELGFPGNGAPEILSSLSSSFRSIRLELEYLTPGEIALPLTSAGAAVLDLLLTRLRELARQSLENEDALDEYRRLEVSLRKQLGARVDAMDDMRQEISTLKDKVKLRNMRIKELEMGIDKLRSSVKTYTRDISELEKLAQRLDGDLNTANEELQNSNENHQAEVDKLSETLEDRDSTIEALDTKLSLALENTTALKDQLVNLQSQQQELQNQHKDELTSLNKQHGATLALRDTRTSELRLEVGSANEALRQAHEMIQKLRVENGSLNSRLGAEKNKARAAVDAMKAELERAVRMGEDLLASPKSPQWD